MRVGFHLRYRNDDLSQAAIRLAEFVVSQGHDVAFHSIHPRPAQLSPQWDRLVETEADRPFMSWIKDVQVLVALEPFAPEYFQGAAKSKCKVLLLGSWDTVRESLKECYQMADEVICPSAQGTELLRENWGLRNCRHIPWDNGLPATRKADLVDPTRVRILFPMHGWQAGTTHAEILNVIWRTLHRCPFADITLLYGARSFNTNGFKAIKKISKTFLSTGQFRPVSDRRLTRAETLLHYARSDLVAWAAEQEGLAMIGLDALAMGTPVLAYDVAPQNEYLHDRKNALLVPCELKYNWLGVPWAQPNDGEFEEHLTGLIGRPRELNELRRFTRFGMAARRDRFLAGWTRAISSR